MGFLLDWASSHGIRTCSSPTIGLPGTPLASKPCWRDELGMSIPALVLCGDTGSAATRARATGLTLLSKPVIPAVLEAARPALLEPGAEGAA